MHGAAVATVNDDDSYDNEDSVASVRHQDPPQAAQFKNRGHEWEGGRTPRKKARGGEASPISCPNHERAHTVAGAGIDAMDKDNSGDEDDALGDDDDDDANDGADDADNNADDDDAEDIASVGRRTQRGRQSDPADRASGWRRATTPTKMLTERRRGATARTVNDDGPGGGKMTNNELASGGRGREPNHIRRVGPAVAWTRTVLTRVHDFRQDPISLAVLAVLNTPCQATKACRLPERGPATAGTPTRRATPQTPRTGAACKGSVAELATPKQQPGHRQSGTTRRPPTYPTTGLPTTQPMRIPTTRPTEGVIVKGCRRCGVVWTAEKNFQGKTGQRGSAANFLPAQERQHKKEAAIAHGVHGGTHFDRQGLPGLFGSTAEEIFQDRKRQRVCKQGERPRAR
jgi:hypothetical protein